MRHHLPARLAFAAAVVGIAGAARADSSRISLEVGGIVSSVDVAAGTTPPPYRSINSFNGGAASTTSDRVARDTIVGVELRPTFNVVGGLRLGVGFRAGSAPATVAGDTVETSLFGGDVSAGYHRKVGRLMPYGEVRFGFNAFQFTTPSGSRTATEQLRLDAVLGARFYMTPGLFVAASGFAGWGDLYGGTVAVGFDVVRYKMKGALP